METKLRDLLDLIYELEGLLHLSLKRDEFQEDFLRLIVKKGEEVSKICENLVGPQMKEEGFPFDLNEYFIADEPDKDNFEGNITLNEHLTEEIPMKEEKDKVKEEKDQENLTKSSDRGKLVFSINDKFRFRKELFENSDIDFNNSLALVASMDDFDEAEYYFINDIGLNPADPTVKDFFDIVKRYFS